MSLKPLLFFLAVGALAGYFVYDQAVNGHANEVVVGGKAPEFALKDGSAKEVHLSDYRGKLVFLNFFWTDCEPCIEEMPDLQVIDKLFAGRQFQMLIVSVDTNWKDVDDFYSQHHMSFATLLDPARAVYRKYQLTATPETFLIDGNGFIIKHYIGPAAWTSPAVLSYLEDWVHRQEVSETASVAR